MKKSKKKVYVDVEPLYHQMTGICHLTFELVSRMLSFSDFCYVLISTKEMRYAPKGDYKFKSFFRDFRPGRLRLLLWYFFLGFYLRFKKADVFFGPRNVLPFFLGSRIKKLLFVHDLVLVKTPETMKVSSFYRCLMRFFLKCSIKKADVIFTYTDVIRKEIIDIYNISPDRVCVLYPGKTNLVIKECEKPHTKDYILFLGTVEPRKNLRRLVMAYSQLPQELKNQYDLVIVGGSGWGDVNLPALTKELGIDGFVHITGYVSNDLRAAYLKHATMLAFPSIYEGFGFPIVEAFQAGVPVLTSKGIATEEVVDTAAELIDPVSVESIKQGLERMLSSKERREELIMQSAQRLSMFDWDDAAKKLLEFI